MKEIKPEDLVFIDESGILLGRSRAYGRSEKGTRVRELKPYYRGAKITLVGAISQQEVLALMTLDGSLDGEAFKVFINDFILPKLWPGAVVVMDNLPVHKLASIVSKIEAVGASVIYLSPYSPDFNPIEMWWSQLKSFVFAFAPTTRAMIDVLLSVALKLIDPEPLKNWFTHCCYCPS
ncbi:IS630 family transposase [Roseofilum reptotaenium CS-1145]|uniref:Transposase n=1 Tax=Roseofilum reptotaenium AO1-A TaxID=1925591 RepID=A0A1L9QR81_9CYAN|nr:IS630 family transposase [Roseofilum reptotaenium CS-1145]OJJ25174.1 transposase [Roseofilum reptotaenium AO1-A]